MPQSVMPGNGSTLIGCDSKDASTADVCWIESTGYSAFVWCVPVPEGRAHLYLIPTLVEMKCNACTRAHFKEDIIGRSILMMHAGSP